MTGEAQKWIGLDGLLHLNQSPDPAALGEEVDISTVHDLDWDAAVCLGHVF